ncbi:MAG TPA: PilZ domain-containing protein [Vicinamibacterales bacterium]
MADCTVVIAPEGLLDPLVARLKSLPGEPGEIIACSDADIPRAIAIILERVPQRVALERLFAATSRGAALLERLKSDPALADVEFRIVSHDSDYWRVSPRRTPPRTDEAARPEPPVERPPLDTHGTRRHPRTVIQEGVDILIDGLPARLVNLSPLGAQVLSSSVLRPNQRVRVSMVDHRDTIRCPALVVWARFELTGGSAGPRYRAGLEFSAPDAQAVLEYAERHRARE